MSSTSFTRLPETVKPVNYSLELQPDIKSFTFNGRVVIDLAVRQFNFTKISVKLYIIIHLKAPGYC